MADGARGPGLGSRNDETGSSAGLTLAYTEARKRKSGNPRARWRNVAEELSAAVYPQVAPSFRLRPGETVFTIGSCFARNIEAHLAALGCKVPMLDFRLPPEEFDGVAHSALNLFHPAAFRQCLEWTARIYDRDGKVTWEDCTPIAFDLGDGAWFDMEIARTETVSADRFLERRQHLYDIFSSVFRADCLMMTPGVIEAWRDLDTGRYTYGPPYFRPMLQTPDRWAFEVLSFQQCLDDLLAAIEVVRARNPEVNVLVTTSPVPLGTTFTGRDVTIANAHSKAVLRAVCDTAVLNLERADYFPSYEMATLSNPGLVWKEDRIHVSEAFIGKIVGYMLDNYFEHADPAGVSLQRAHTLLGEGRGAEAEAAALEVLALRPGDVDAPLILGMALIQQRRWDDAEHVLAPLAEACPDRTDARVQLARALAGSHRVAEAVEQLDRALDCAGFSLADFIRSRQVLRRVSAEEAVRLGFRFIERLPLHSVVRARLADDLLRAGRKEEAVVEMRRVARQPHPPAAMLVQLARLVLDMGERGEARAHLTAALAEDPKNEEVPALLRALDGAEAPA